MEFKHTNLPIESEFPKLIRDKIPEINKKNYGKELPVRTAENDAEYIKYLAKKLIEEAVEIESAITGDGWKEDLADLLEVAEMFRKAKKMSARELISIRKEKTKQKGGFKKRILMLERNT